VRCFVALDLPTAVRQQLYEAAAPLRRLGDVRWVSPEHLHVTLKFLGESDDRVIAGMRQALEALVLPPLQLALFGLGSFPKRGAPRVVWAGLSGEVERVRMLAGQLEDAAADLGVARESRPFSPHVTLGRARSPRQSLMLERAIASASSTVDSAPFQGVAVTLYQSELSRFGANYTSLRTRQVPFA
jgi:RNA 2',3'-cyclic 3'-phosphodiesterase